MGKLRQRLSITPLPCPTHTARTPCLEAGPEWALLCHVPHPGGVRSLPPSPRPLSPGPTEGPQAGCVCWTVSISSRMGGLQEEATSRLRPKSRRGCVQRFGAVRRLPGTGWGVGRACSSGPEDRPQGRPQNQRPSSMAVVVSRQRPLQGDWKGHRRLPRTMEAHVNSFSKPSYPGAGRWFANGGFLFFLVF